MCVSGVPESWCGVWDWLLGEGTNHAADDGDGGGDILEPSAGGNVSIDLAGRRDIRGLYPTAPAPFCAWPGASLAASVTWLLPGREGR